jgi:integrase
MSIKKRTFIDRNGKVQVRYRVNVYNKYTARSQWVGTFERRKDAESAFDQAKRTIRLGELPAERKDIGFGDLLDRWLSTLTVRASTREEYKYAGVILRRYFKNRPVSSIDRELVEHFVAWVVEKKYSVRYVRKLKTRLAQVLKVGVDWGYLKTNPAAGKVNNLPKEPKSKIMPLEPDQVRSLLRAAPEYHRPLFLVLVSTGLRRSEAFGLTWNNVDLERGEIRVTHQLQSGALVEPKSDAAMRTIPLASVTVGALRARKNVITDNPLNLVFTTERGAAINASNFYKRLWRPVREAAELPEGTTLHQLRKTFATACAGQGRSPAWLAEVMGHESPTTTLAFYTSVLQRERDQAKKDMDEWLGLEARGAYGHERVVVWREMRLRRHCSTAVARGVAV